MQIVEYCKVNFFLESVFFTASALSGSNPYGLLNMIIAKKTTTGVVVFLTIGTPIGIRTPDLRIRSALLYPAELWALIKLY